VTQSPLEIIRRLEAGERLDAVFAPVMTDAERAVLRRCAVPRSFDRELFEAVLRLHEDGMPDLDALLRTD
jgi:hypothetical protein